MANGENDELAKGIIREMLSQQFTWQGILNSLGSGFISGVGSWAAGYVLDYIFGRDMTVRELYEAMPEIVRNATQGVVNEDNLRQAYTDLEDHRLKLNMLLEGVAMNELEEWHSNLHHAVVNSKTLGVFGLNVHVLTVLCYIGLCEYMLNRSPNVGVTLTNHKRRYIDNIKEYANACHDYILECQVEIMDEKIPPRITLRTNLEFWGVVAVQVDEKLITALPTEARSFVDVHCHEHPRIVAYGSERSRCDGWFLNEEEHLIEQCKGNMRNYLISKIMLEFLIPSDNAIMNAFRRGEDLELEHFPDNVFIPIDVNKYIRNRIRDLN